MFSAGYGPATACCSTARNCLRTYGCGRGSKTAVCVVLPIATTSSSADEEGDRMRVYLGERADGRAQVWIANRMPRPDLAEIVEVLAGLRRLNEDPPGTSDYERQRAEYLSRKDELIERIEATSNAPRPVALVHRG